MVTLQKRFGKTGTVKSENGALYIGNFDENGVKTGLGRYSVQLVQCAVHTVSSPDCEDNLDSLCTYCTLDNVHLYTYVYIITDYIVTILL